jgi:hypothetical protein
VHSLCPLRANRATPSLDGIFRTFYEFTQGRKVGCMAGEDTGPGKSTGEISSVHGEASGSHAKPNPAQRRYLVRGLDQAGGKLPLFDEDGQHIHPALVRACIAHGWAEPWFGNPLKPDWLVCKLTEKGRRALAI